MLILLQAEVRSRDLLGGGPRALALIAIFAPEAKSLGRVRVMVTVDDLDRARVALKREKIRFSEEEVLDMELDNRPGAFGELAGKFARAKINIRYAYATTSAFASARVIIAVPDVKKALAALIEKTRPERLVLVGKHQFSIETEGEGRARALISVVHCARCKNAFSFRNSIVLIWAKEVERPQLTTEPTR